MTIVPLANQFMPLVRSGEKRSTIRRGIRLWSRGPAILRSDDEELRVAITQLKFTTVAKLTESDAAADGFSSLRDLLEALRGFYPNISLSDEVTIAYFRTH